MADGGGAAGGGAGADYKLSATLELRDQLTGKLKSAASQLKSMNGAVQKLGSQGEVAKLARQFNALSDLRKQVEQFKQLKKNVSATRQAYEQSNAATAKLAQQYRMGQSVVGQLQAKHDELKRTFDTSRTTTAKLQEKLGGLKAEAAKLRTDGAREEYKKLQNQIKATSDELKASQAMTRSTGAELKTLAGGLKQAKSELKSIGNAFEQSKNKAAKLKQQLNTQLPELHRQRQSLAAQGFSTRDFVNSDRELRRRMAETAQKFNTQQRIEQLKSTLSAAGMTLPGSSNIRVNVNGNATSTLGKITSQLNNITKKTWNVAVNAKNRIGGKVNDLASGAMFGMGAQMLGTAGIGYGMIDMINTYKDFEYQMATVKAITNANSEEFALLTKRAKELGATTMFKASEVGKAEEYMAMAGWKTPQITAGLPAVLNLAAASGEELARVSDIVTDSMTAFGLKATDTVKTADGKIVKATDHFADVFAALATNANTTVGMAGETSKYSAAVVGSLYASQSVNDKMRAVEDWAVITGIMANAGIKASMSGTAQRSMLTRLASMQMNADAARKSMGVDFVYQQDEIDKETGELHQRGQTRRLRDIITDIRSRFQGDFDPELVLDMAERLEGKEFTKQQRKKLSSMIENVKANGGKMTDADKATLTAMMSGQEGMSAWLSVLMASNEEFKKMIDAIDTASGSAQKMADTKMNTLEGDIKTLSSAFEALQLEMFEGSGGNGLREFVKGVTEDIRFLKKSLEDGFQITDLGGMLSKVATQLKDKFLALDGIGSVLAGGALAMGLKKIYNLTMRLKDAAMLARTWWQGTAATQTGRTGGLATTGGIGSAVSSVGTMNVNAGVVNINGKIAAQGGTATTATQGSRTAATASTTAATATAGMGSAPSKLKMAGSAAAGAGILTAIFAIMDNYSTRSTNETRQEEALSVYKEAEEKYNLELAAYNAAKEDPERQSELPERQQLLTEATQSLESASQNLKTIQKEAVKYNNESFFGGVGGVAGAATGAAIGSVIPGLGTVAGGIVGLVLSMAGAALGSGIGKDIGDNLDYDFLGFLKGGNDKTPAGVIKKDWQLDDGRMYNSLSTTEKIRYAQHESATERERRENSERQQWLEINSRRDMGTEVIERYDKTHTQPAKYDESFGITNRYGEKVTTPTQGEFSFDTSVEGTVAQLNKKSVEESSESALVQNMRRYSEEYSDYTKPVTAQADTVGNMYDTGLAKEVTDIFKQERIDANNLKRFKSGEFGDNALADILNFNKNQADITDFSKPVVTPQNSAAASMYDTSVAKETAAKTIFSSVAENIKKNSMNYGAASQPAVNQMPFMSTQYDNASVKKSVEDVSIKDTIQNEIDYLKSLFKSDSESSSTENKSTTSTLSEQASMQATSAQFSPPAAGEIPDISKMWKEFNFKDLLPDFSLSDWFAEKAEGMPDLSQMWSNFKVSDMLPEISLSDWFKEKTVGLPDMSSVSSKLSESFSQVTSGVSETISNVSTWMSEIWSNVSTSASEGLSSVSTSMSEIWSNISTSASEGLSSVSTSMSEIWSNVSTSVSEGLSSVSMSMSEIWSNISTSASEGLSSVSTSMSEIWSGMSVTMTEVFTSISTYVSETFTNISTSVSQIPTAASGAFSTILTSASNALTTIQTEWGQLPSFFGGVFSGLGGAASAAGSAIYSGLTSVIGGIIGAWQSAAATVSGIISRISSAASNAASAAGSFIGIGANATGTMSWRGGLTEVNEHGGEIIDLPRGTRIYPHATTLKMLQRDMEKGELDNFSIGHNATGTMSWRGGLTEVNEHGGEIIDLPNGNRVYPQFTALKMLKQNFGNRLLSSLNNSFLSFPTNDFSTFPQAIQFDDISNQITRTSNSSTTNTNSGITISGNTFNVRKESDINEIAFRLLELMSDHHANYAGA